MEIIFVLLFGWIFVRFICEVDYNLNINLLLKKILILNARISVLSAH